MQVGGSHVHYCEAITVYSGHFTAEIDIAGVNHFLNANYRKKWVFFLHVADLTPCLIAVMCFVGTFFIVCPALDCRCVYLHMCESEGESMKWTSFSI